MSHFSDTTSRAERTPDEWLKVGAQIGELVNAWSERGDLIAYVGPGAGGPAAACFKPALAEMEVNVDVAFGEGTDPETLGNINHRKVQFEYPAASGAILHEAMHAKHSHWSLAELAKHPHRQEAKLVELFEETRIESRGITAFPSNRAFLRACALQIVVNELNEEEVLKNGIMGLSQLMLLVPARVDAGVLEESDVTFVETVAREFLGDELYDQLRELWLKAQAHGNDTEWLPMRDLAEEWLRLLEDAGHDTKGEDPEGEGTWAAVLGEMIEQLGEQAEETAIAAQGDAFEQAADERDMASAAARDAAAEESREHRKTAERVFSRSTGPGSSPATDSTLVEKRQPTAKERAAAVKVSKALEKARYIDRVVVDHSSVLPPGKLRSRAAVQAAAARNQGRMTDAEPWHRRQRFHVEDPELKVGVMVDISGSMGSAMQPMAVTAWMLSEAVKRVQGQAAMVYFGNDVFPVLKPGQHLKEVTVYSAPDGTERFDRAFQSLNGALDLLNGSGARLLVIVSDLCYTFVEQKQIRVWMKRCKDAGVGVLILTFDTGEYANPVKADPANDVHVINGRMDPAKAATVIGAEVIKVLEKASARRA